MDGLYISETDQRVDPLDSYSSRFCDDPTSSIDGDHRKKKSAEKRVIPRGEISFSAFYTFLEICQKEIPLSRDLFFEKLRLFESIREDHIDRVVRDLDRSDNRIVVTSKHTATNSLRELSRVLVAQKSICELEVVR